MKWLWIAGGALVTAALSVAFVAILTRERRRDRADGVA